MLLRHIRYLIAVAEHGNFTRAAEALHVSQPTLSLQIRQLEERLGAQLLDRSGRVVRVTDAGSAYVEHARRALRELEAGARAIDDVHGMARGALRLATTPTFTAYLTGPLLAAYHARHPGIALHLREMPLDLIEAALADDEVDLAIAFSEVRSAELECQPLFAEQLSVVVGQDHPCAKRRKPLTPAELARQPLALLSADFATRGYVDAYFRRQDIVPRIAIEANTISALVEIVRRGKLATILPSAISAANPQLRNVKLEPALPQRGVALLRRKGAYLSAAAEAFSALTREYGAGLT